MKGLKQRNDLKQACVRACARVCVCVHVRVRACILCFVGDYAGFPGCGLLRLHSTYRHDLKIYASDEGRVQMTAAAFAKVRSILLF